MREKTEPDRDTYMQRNATHSLLRIVRRTHDPNEVCTPLDYYYLRFRSFPTDEEIIDLFSCLQHVLGEHADYLEAHFGFYDPATDDPATLSFGEQLVSIHSIIVQTLQNPENPPDVVVPHAPQNYGIYPTFSEFKLSVILRIPPGPRRTLVRPPGHPQAPTQDGNGPGIPSAPRPLQLLPESGSVAKKPVLSGS